MEVVTSVLALVAGAGAIVLVVASALGGRVPALASLVNTVHARRTEWTFAVSGVATLGSLYFSEVADYLPCRLCWFQRILMYPIALVALVALLRRDPNSHWYTVPFAAIGAAVSLYHYLVEWGVFDDSEACLQLGTSCAAIWFREFGFVSLAFMALCGFVAIIVVNVVPARATPPIPAPEEAS